MNDSRRAEIRKRIEEAGGITGRDFVGGIECLRRIATPDDEFFVFLDSLLLAERIDAMTECAEIGRKLAVYTADSGTITLSSAAGVVIDAILARIEELKGKEG